MQLICQLLALLQGSLCPHDLSFLLLQLTFLGNILDNKGLPHPPPAGLQQWYTEDLKILLKESDFLSIHTPLTKETQHLISEVALKQMKRTAFLINVSRGPIIDKDALLKALQHKWIAGVGLDVFWEEPADPSDLLFQFENVITLPHIAGSSNESQDRIEEVVVSNIIRVARGETPINLH